MAWSIISISAENSGLLNNVASDVFDYPISAAYLKTYLAQPTHQLIVAVDEGQVIGHIRAVIHYQPDEAHHLYIDNLGVEPEFQRQGVASALFDGILAWGKSQGCKSYWVATECDNDEGNNFYRAIGLKSEQMYFYETKIQ
ncbi:GNAT family N-acetyltransferase [Maritalea sp.]|uniref:GNAT family N-acetyltransferase n=1 Tax=Maritalea sp. TaxID=2003361 RepID=UPI003EF2A8D6